ncbi:MAG: DNA primase DnaG [Candidatus Micrarchaeota archaeon]
MGKTYIDAVKYLIKSNYEIDGSVEKPDIVGAIFGQTEGLLGDDLDLRELQKNGRIGRIEVESQVRGGKTYGTILMPSSLDMVETSILAASLEIVDRVGPCDARINIVRIEDSRNVKRKQVLDKAKVLLKTLMNEELPESKELSEMVREDAKVSDVMEYGEDRLPAGPAVDSNEDILVVEGRADVINLLKNNIKNVIAVGGAKVGKTITQLGKKKEVTVFLDGDRGGDIILRELVNATDVDYVARAPNGMEVEELSRKELIKCIRRRVPIEQVDGYEHVKRVPIPNSQAVGGQPIRREDVAPRNMPPQQRPFEARRVEPQPRFERPAPVQAERLPEVQQQSVPVQEAQIMTPEESAKADEIKKILKELEGSLKARILDAGLSSTAEVPIREIMKTLGETNGAFAVVLDGIVTQRLIDLAEQKGAKFIVGIRSGNVTRYPDYPKIVLAE